VTTKHGSAASYEEDLRAPAHVIEAHRANQAAGSTVEVAPLHGAGKAQRVAVSKLKSRAVQMLKSEQHRRIEQHARPIINQLNKHERKAFYAVAEGWAPADAKKRQLAHLQRRADILATSARPRASTTCAAASTRSARSTTSSSTRTRRSRRTSARPCARCASRTSTSAATTPA
jgi:hypothetical protein